VDFLHQSPPTKRIGAIITNATWRLSDKSFTTRYHAHVIFAAASNGTELTAARGQPNTCELQIDAAYSAMFWF
jgi:hypothetical protein